MAEREAEKKVLKEKKCHIFILIHFFLIFYFHMRFLNLETPQSKDDF